MKPRHLLFLSIVVLVAAASVTIYLLRHPKGGTYEQSVSSTPFDHAHATFDRVLRTHVKDGLVDYTSIKNNPADLDTFLEDAAAVKESTYDTWSQNQQLAFLIDLYNAATIRLIIDNYPLESIKDIGNAIVGAWQKPVVRLFGKRKTLDYLEHSLIREKFDDPRIHFALVCAAISCPPLRAEAFVPDKLDAQLDDQGRTFLADKTKNRLSPDTKTAHISKIFDWFRGDFTKDGRSLLEALAPWFSESDRQLIESEDLKIEFQKYDWSLNGTR